MCMHSASSCAYAILIYSFHAEKRSTLQGAAVQTRMSAAGMLAKPQCRVHGAPLADTPAPVQNVLLLEQIGVAFTAVHVPRALTEECHLIKVVPDDKFEA